MNLTYTDEQRLLRESVAGFFARHYDFDIRRSALANGGWKPAIWKAFANDLGLLGMTAPERIGGFGGGPVETMIVLEEIGRALVLEPYLECAVLGGALLRDGGEIADAMAGGIIDGSVRPVAALWEDGARYDVGVVATTAKQAENGGWVIEGGKIAVAAAPCATHFLVSARTAGEPRDRGGIALFLVPSDAAGLERSDYALIDGRRASDIKLQGVQVGADALIGTDGAALPVIERALDEAIAALCGEAVGVMRRMLESTVDYARQREQFGRPIAGFQVLQHRMVDMHTRIERAHSLAIMAALSLDLPEAERRKAVSAAKAFVSDAAKFVAQAAVQIHGGIGTTDELAISHYFKRATVIENQFGSAAYHLRRVADAMDAED
ncbi:acyl-CoA dehydrogenase family protein [Sphingomonas oryzagri]